LNRGPRRARQQDPAGSPGREPAPAKAGERRLQGVNSIAAGNQLLPCFWADYNARFGKEPHNSKNLHRPLSADDKLADVFAWREERTISNNLTLQYDKLVFLVEPNEFTRELRRKRVTVLDYPDGRPAIRYGGLDLPHTTIGEKL
jgi:hypothetical protein